MVHGDEVTPFSDLSEEEFEELYTGVTQTLSLSLSLSLSKTLNCDCHLSVVCVVYFINFY